MLKTKNVFIGIVVTFIWLCIWQIFSALTGLDFLFPSPVKVFLCLWGMIRQVNTWQILLNSCFLIMIGFFASFFIAVVLGIISHKQRVIKIFLSPVVEIMKSLPVAAFIILVLMWAGASRVAMIISGIVVFPIVYHCIMEALDNLSKELDEMSAVFGLSQQKKMCYIIFPQCIPYLRTALKTSVGMGIKAGIAAEVIGLSPKSIGGEMYLSKLYLEGDLLLAWGFLIIVVSFLLEEVLLRILSLIFVFFGRWNSCNDLEKIRSMALNETYDLMDDTTDAANERIVVDNLTKSFDGENVLKDVSLEVSSGQILCLMGESGVGKTTMLKCILGIEKVDSGNIHLPGDVSAVFQESRLCEHMSAMENVCMVMDNSIGCKKKAMEMLLELLDEDSITKPVKFLSGGMKRRCEIVRAFAKNSKAIVLDEPFAGLDDVNKKLSMKFIMKHSRKRPIVITTHDYRDVDDLNAKAFIIDKELHN